MALVIRFSLGPWRPNSVHPPRLHAKVSAKTNAFGKLDFEGLLHSGEEKSLKRASKAEWLLKSEKKPCLPFEMNETLPTTQYLSSKLHDSWWNVWEGTRVMGQIVADCDNIVVKQIFGIQGKASYIHPAKAFVVANVFMLIMPFEAVAETCEATSSLFNMPILLAVALVGATVGGLLARQRKGELQRLNDQLRLINAALRRQAKIESYAPSLSYAPVGSKMPEEVIVDSRKHELLSRLKSGKNLLRNQDPEKAYVEFKAALEIAQNVKDPVEEKKAARGLGASLQRQGKYKDAITHHSLVLSISDRVGESSGNTEAYGAIADCYTELGDLEKAGQFYDKYIATLETD